MSLFNPDVFLRNGINCEKVEIEGAELVGRFTIPTVAMDDHYRRIPTFLTKNTGDPEPLEKLLIRPDGSMYRIKEVKPSGENQFWLMRLKKA